ncbi:predicted protein [Lichtheimia corymbifera JMRC:FSU:9682]|uniref:Uncharacterized protein n=1 Tax=Lichtheimia corymbifera JMRC:FSU:9682 TaxID=1263082 RepID=A0A068RPS2_9FUNG|nr:predicted protein [Lichtheimia corymbifera JMRC:FSU:9682]
MAAEVVGYIYLQTLKMDVYIPTLIDAIFLPSEFCQLKLFRKTLYALFIWKNFITELIATVKVSLTSRSQGANPCTTQGANPCIQGANPFPQIHYACCRLLTGMILSETSTGKAMIVSSVEIYGRRRSLDAHRESFQVKKRLPLPHHCLLKGQEFQTVQRPGYLVTSNRKLALMFYRIEKRYGIKSKKENGWTDDFRASSYWPWLYYHTMEGDGNDNEKIDWDSVQAYYTDKVRHHQGSTGDMGPTARATYTPRYKDGEYVDSDDED